MKSNKRLNSVLYSPKPKKQRNKQILRYYQKGLNCAEIGKKFGLTKQRVHQIIKHFQAVDKSTLDTDGKEQ